MKEHHVHAYKDWPEECLCPGEVLDALFGVDVEPEEGELEVEIKEHNAALVVDGGKEKMVGEGFGGEEVPTGRGDQRREVMKF